jgi:hypothetical protein
MIEMNSEVKKRVDRICVEKTTTILNALSWIAACFRSLLCRY